MSKPSVAVVGGGIAGLCAAFDLHNAGCAVTVFEASDLWGGKIQSSPVGDRMVDSGPDTFLARVEPGHKLALELGLGDQLTSPVAPVPAYIHRDSQLHELPKGTFMGIPTDLDLFSQTSLISQAGIRRASEDLTLPATPISGDVSVGEYCRARVGDEVTDRLIDPLLGGINASQIDRLSLASGSPQIAAAAAAGPSLITELAKMQERIGSSLGSADDAPVFYGLEGGIATLIDALVDRLAGADMRLGTQVQSLADLAEFDRIILGTPAPVTSALLAPISPSASTALSEIEYASVAQVTVELAIDKISPILDASGVLFPRIDGMILTACTWFSTKWAHYARPNSVLVRLTSGRFGDDRAMVLADDKLVSHLMAELGTVFDIEAPPTATRVHRWVDALPQYTPGHAKRVETALQSLEADAGHIQLVGASYNGIGIPACIASGRAAAQQLTS